jgi:RNA polymerase sigma factor (TIGR02999 family)
MPLAAPPPSDAPASTPPITLLLRQAALGDRAALDRIYASLYPDLKRLAHARLRDQGRGEAMNTTTLVHESFMRLVASRGLSLDDRRHFFAYAATTMRHIIIDSARAVQTERRGSGAAHVTLADDEAQSVADERSCRELLRVHEALLALEALDPDLSQIVEMRYFGGYSEPEMADLLGVGERTVQRRWNKARAWLMVALQ